MGQARRLMDRFTEAALINGDLKQVGDCFAVVYVATNTGPLVGPDGGTLPATGRQIRLASCEVGTVENGVFTGYRFYNDRMAFLTQLGLLEAP